MLGATLSKLYHHVWLGPAPVVADAGFDRAFKNWVPAPLQAPVAGGACPVFSRNVVHHVLETL